eukprot:CAMPEP_0184716020 /NCGR_PEP_ID=MMETSP0314-20130426/5848_1 /TAXON_ID=38298 /ORGANISM="Rhodella maculata, Strain CCMP 736" /LENGTH=121 /DNA_ID=CAMNT_0027179323 /DNA_START=286 /DNA_END=652 /DNA_ORIENTATION=-
MRDQLKECHTSFELAGARILCRFVGPAFCKVDAADKVDAPADLGDHSQKCKRSRRTKSHEPYIDFVCSNAVRWGFAALQGRAVKDESSDDETPPQLNSEELDAHAIRRTTQISKMENEQMF